MNQGQYKKKMTFDEYENKFSSKLNNTTNKQGKRPIAETSKPIETTKSKIVTTTKQQYSQKPFININSRSSNVTNNNLSNLTHGNLSNVTHGNLSNVTIINQTSFITNSNRLDSYQQQSSSQPLMSNNHHNAHQVTHATIPQPISHSPADNSHPQQHSTQPLSQISHKPQEVNKIDLIFQKEPEDVQKKLRMLLLNYNAVMQYNQKEDNFEVDLLLPFNTPEEKNIFVDKFMKTRHYLNEQIQQDQLLNHQKNNQQNISKDNQHSSNNLSHQSHPPNLNNSHQRITEQKRNTTQFHTINPHSNQPHSNPNKHSSHPQNTHISTAKSPNEFYEDGDNVLSTSLREEAQMIQQEKELQESDNKIDFFALSQSLDLSIHRGLTLIRQQKLIKQQKQLQAHRRAQTHSRGQIDSRKSIQKENHQTSKEHSNQQDSHMYIKATQSDSHRQPQQVQQQYQEPASQIQSQISQGQKPNFPHSIERNILHTPSGKKTTQQSAWMKPLQPNESQGRLANSSLDYSHEEYSRMIKPTGNSLYESPIVPLKHVDSYDRNNTSNEILIEDLESQYQMKGYKTPDKEEQGHREYQMEQESYSSAFDMIEETAEEHQDEYFPSSLEYKEFLKKKINDTSMKSASKSKYSLKESSGLISKQQSTGGYSRDGSSSLRAKYSQFLSKNHKKIEGLYLRIGRQMRKKRQQQENEKAFSSQKGKQWPAGEILVADDDSEEINEKQLGLLEGYKKKIVIQNESMSSEDKVRYFRYLARHAKGLYIDFIRNQNSIKRNQN